MSTGEVLRVRAAMKPIATVPRALRTVDVATGEAAVAHHQRSDVCAVPAAGIVAEAMVALVLADAVLEKFGGDSVGGDPPQRRGLPRASLRLRGDRAEPDGPRVVLVGPMGAGKTTVGRTARRALGRRASATPTTTSRPRAGKPISDIFVDDGEARFRALERAAVVAALAAHAGVLALGGGAVLDADDPRDAARATGWCSSRSGSRDAVKRVGLGVAPAAAARQRPRPRSRRCSTSGAPVYAEVATRHRRHRRPHARGRRRRGRRLVEAGERDGRSDA